MTLPTPPSVPAANAMSAAQLAKAALRRLALEKREPTPENYARAYEQEGGAPRAKPASPAPPPAVDNAAPQVAALIARVVRGVERGSRSWTTARKKDGLQRVLDSSRTDLQRLSKRLDMLLASWDSDTVAAASGADAALTTETAGLTSQLAIDSDLEAPAGAAAPTRLPALAAPAWQPIFAKLSATLASALPEQDPGCRTLSQELANVALRIQTQGAAPGPVHEMAEVCERVRAAVQQRQRLIEQLTQLCRELAASMAELAESDSWAKGQCEAMHNALEMGVTTRTVKAVNELLRDTRKRQGALRAEREQARDALRDLVSSMLGGLKELGSHTGRLHDNVSRYTVAIEQADTLGSLASVVSEMVVETRSVQGLMTQTRSGLEQEHAKASALSDRVTHLEGELLRLSNEVTTDQLTQVANRRGLLKVFDVERARMHRSSLPLAVGLLDIDNFKRLNDELGHGVGDEALKALATLVRDALRPTDLVARFGGEEFVVLLPESTAEQAQDILTRMQRKLSSGLFLHEGKDVLVTFSAGVTPCGLGESIENVLERADRALYEAKRTGKNRTCIA